MLQTTILSFVVAICTGVLLFVLNSWWQQRKDQFTQTQDRWEKVSNHISKQVEINKSHGERIEKLEDKIK